MAQLFRRRIYHATRGGLSDREMRDERQESKQSYVTYACMLCCYSKVRYKLKLFAHFIHSSLQLKKILEMMISPLRHITSRHGRKLVHRLAGASQSASPCFSTSPATQDKSEALSSAKLQELYDTIVKLPREDVNILGALVIQVLGVKIFTGEFGGGGVAPVGVVAEEENEAVEAKTAFDLKLIGFDAKAKIKVIKEIRAIAGLGLKEAKELVESAPKVIQKDLKQDKADELKALLEAVGAQVEIV